MNDKKNFLTNYYKNNHCFPDETYENPSDEAFWLGVKYAIVLQVDGQKETDRFFNNTIKPIFNA